MALLSLLVLVGLSGACAHAASATDTPHQSNTGDTLWSTLNPTQKSILKPLEQTWTEMPEIRRKKWSEIAKRYPLMTDDEKARMQERMREWAALTPEQRRLARENYRRVQNFPKDERQQQWEQYQQLSDEEKQSLSEQARRARQGWTDPARPAGAAAYTRPRTP
ncbi:MAG: DUF3106 domain-containing protein [Burkholderiaceae bacterium]